MTSFMISLVRTEMVPEKDSEADGVFEIIDLVFTGLFTLELAITLLAHWFFEFWTHGWHVFDSAIVGVSLASVAIPDMPAVNSIRAIRVLRAVRLLRKSKSLAPIVHALFASILPVLNSFVLLGLITAIYASMAVRAHPSRRRVAGVLGQVGDSNCGETASLAGGALRP